MDFIPSASNTYGSLEDERLPFEVPYVGTFTYDFEGFEDFPKRLGFMKDGKLDLETRSLEDCASLMQSWLYFGVICEFIDRPIEVSKFVHTSPQEEGRDVLRWNPCGNEAIDDWKTRMVHLNEGSPMPVITAATARINSVLHHAASHVLEIEQLSFAQTAPIPTICLSIKALLNVLFGALKPWGIYSNPDFAPPYLPVLPHGSNKIPASTYFLMSMMSHQGWCPSQIRGLFEKMDLCTLLFLSQLSRKRGNGTGHSSCSALQCIANNVDMSHYETKHRTPSCRCNTVEVPKSSLVEIIKSGGIPLVSVHAGPYDTIEIHIEKADPSTQYIAISHVWSDGLGNPDSNALPQCQLAWLSSCLERLPPPGYQGISYSTYDGIVMDTSALDAIPQPNAKRPVPRFWMDTLCVPVGNEYAELKTEAINKMAAYYAQATRTLILDGELQGLHLAVLGATEVLARIAHCAWAGRCWTLQEGAISSICYFQCADGALRLDGMNRSQQLKWVLGTSSPVNTMSVIRQYFREGLTEQRVRNLGKSAEVDPSALNELFIRVIQDNFLFRQRVLKYGDVNPAMRYNERVQNSRFITVWNELSQRTTTKLEDIYVIVANLLDFNSGQIMELPAEERLKAVLWSGRYVPLSLLYSDGPRVAPSKNNRERWVPKTPRGSTLDKFPNLEFVADGLLLQSLKVGKHATIMLSRRFYMNRYCFMVNPERRKTYFVKAIRADPDEFQTDTDVATCYIFESAKGDLHDGIGPELKGTCLSISSMKRKVQEPPNHSELTEGGSSQATISLVAIHDCPVRVWEVEHSTMVPASELIEYEVLYKSESAPIVHVEYLKSQWEVVLQTETPRLENAYPRRPFPSSLGSLLHVTFALFVLFILFLGLPFNILLTIKWVQRMENLSKPSIASICLFYVLDIYPPAAIASGLCAIVANLCNIPFGSRHQMGQIFIWAIVQFCVLYLPAPLLVAAFNFGLRGYAYAAWLSTFDEDWSQKNKYALWWKFIGFGLWMSNLRDWAAKKTKCLLYNAENKLRILDWASMWKQKGLRAELAEGAKRNKIENITFDDVIALNLLH